MKASLIGKEAGVAKFEVAFDAEEFENALVEAYKKNKGSFSIDGFRPGKAPRKIIEQHYGEQIFDEEALEELLQTEYPKALMELEIEPIDRPQADIPDLKHGEGFTVTFTVPMTPEPEVKDYEGVQVKAVNYTITDDDVEQQLQGAAARGARFVVTDKAIESGDMVNIDYSGSVDGVQFEGGTDQDYNLTIGSGTFIEGFEEQLIGKKAGEETDVTVTFPAEYHSEELAGREAVFQVKINEVKVEERPELNDEFAQDISEFDTLDDLRADIKKSLEQQAADRAEGEMKDAILEKIYEANDVDVPAVMVDDTLEDMLKEFERNVESQGIKLKQFFEITGQAPNELRERMREDAYKRVKMRLLVSGIARQEGFNATDEDVEEELVKMAEMYGMEADKLREVLGDFQIKLLKDDIKNKKAVDYIYENAIATEE